MVEVLNPLNLPAELLLLAFDENRGQVSAPPGALSLGLAGAVLLELMLQGRVHIAPTRLWTVGAGSTGDALLDPLLVTMRSFGFTGTVKDWLGRLCAAHPELEARVLDLLIANHMVQREYRQVLRWIAVKHIRVVDCAAKRQSQQHIYGLCRHTAGFDRRTLALAGLTTACAIQPDHFTASGWAAVGARVEQLLCGDPQIRSVCAAVSAVRDAMEAAEVAMAIAWM